MVGKATKEVLEKNLDKLCDSERPLTEFLKLWSNDPTIKRFIARDINDDINRILTKEKNRAKIKRSANIQNSIG